MPASPTVEAWHEAPGTTACLVAVPWLRGVVSQPQMMEILRRVEDSDRLVVIDEFSFTFARGVPNMSMTLVAYYRVGNPSPREARSGVL